MYNLQSSKVQFNVPFTTLVLQVSTDVRYPTSSSTHQPKTGFVIATTLGSFVGLLHVKHFLGSENFLEPALSQITCISACDNASAGDMSRCLALPLPRCYSLRPRFARRRLVGDTPFAFLRGDIIVSLRATRSSHFDSHFSRTFHNCLSELAVEGWVAPLSLSHLDTKDPYFMDLWVPLPVFRCRAVMKHAPARAL